MASLQTRNRRIAISLVTLVVGMLGLAYASVPLYELFCRVTGYGGTPKIKIAGAPVKKSNGTIEVRFDANTNKALQWHFKPVQVKQTVKLGEPSLAFYRVKNTSANLLTGTAIFNVTPFKAASYFSKIDCFCFVEQTLKPGQEIDMPVEFFVDPEIFSDPKTQEISAITLSYTFYPVERDEDNVDRTLSRKSGSNDEIDS
ncbi:MAG: cytochrome c oxidase assembly protein [Rhodospirillaceae bacterium TMED8]|nr:cytochrome c oxidase assembly protein [Magnetovibrio sp.]OUT52238.1 MAG: cytochrome c oxidase assembly protein [Rhodospirillaceae bacterium TMED8]